MKAMTDLELQAYDLILNREFNKAYILIATYESQQPYSRGINMDWNAEAEDGLPSHSIKVYEYMFDKKINLPSEFMHLQTQVKSLIILYNMLGKSQFLPYMLKRMNRHVPVDLNLVEQYRMEIYAAGAYYESALLNMLKLHNYWHLSFRHYSSNCICDEKSCEFCKNMSGKILPISEAVIGKNCPPFHDRCRCAIVPMSEFHYRTQK